jgi:hypothetical protein
VANPASSIALDFDGGRSIRFRLLWEQAPHTCAAVVGALPFHGEAAHGMYSGPVAVFFFEEELALEPENATTSLTVGELVYTYYPANWRQHFPLHTSEVYWSYDAPARPTVPGLFVPALASVFATHDSSGDELEAFVRWSASLHREGVKDVRAEARP